MNALAGALLLAAVLADAKTAPVARKIHRLEIAGGVQMLSLDRPVKSGRVYLFHRYPDGTYLSVPASDVLGIATTTPDASPKSDSTVFLGPTGEGIRREPSDRAAPEPRTDPAYDAGYYEDWCYGCYSPAFPGPRPAPAPPSFVGPNGFPLLPGSPSPLPIGSNGYPILSPAPPVAAPR